VIRVYYRLQSWISDKPGQDLPLAKVPMLARLAFLLPVLLSLTPGLATGRALQPEAQEKSQKLPDQAQEVVSLDTNLVVLNVTVTDQKENYVAGLKVDDFSVFEDGVPQLISSFSFSEMPFAAVILVDTSASMAPKLSLARAACARFAEGIRVGDMVAIYSFGGTRVRQIQDFTESRDVHPLLWEIRAEGETPLYDSIVEAAEALSRRPERRRAILIISDGADTSSRASFEEAMRKAIAAGVAIYSVDLSDSALYRRSVRDSGGEVLKALSSRTGGRHFITPGGSKLREAFEQTVEELRNQYTITYEPLNERQDGRWRSIEVKLKQPELNIRTRQGYYARKGHK
jgi:Ca-activated chloride channel family protein